MGLPKANRLKHRRDFQAVYRQGIRRYGSYLILRALPEPIAASKVKNPTSFGISIGQKVSKKAVIRNRIKRQIKSAIRALLPQINSGWKVVIVVRSEAVECKYEHFLRELKQLLINANLIDGH